MIKLLFIWSTAVSTILMLIYQIEGKEIKIYRDRWGVPHIYADTAADVAYGLGYAQAEDRLEAVLKNYLTATGRMSEVFGPDYIDSDFQQQAAQEAAVTSSGPAKHGVAKPLTEKPKAGSQNAKK